MNTINNSITNSHVIFWVIYLHNKWELELETWKNDRFRIANAYAAVTQILTSQPRRLVFTWMVTYIRRYIIYILGGMIVGYGCMGSRDTM
jgi:hypothetical protein